MGMVFSSRFAQRFAAACRLRALHRFYWGGRAV